ncbi:EAL domain-containing response regulator [Glaciimonas sp. Gout2]|uniref:EAL domain-containing response regulator n=1 Tax=unclassified Glaciimonas TaxID=2644401 RepID=UPI002B232B62|nr:MULTISPECIES: EAL domain-containing response regulator [unclassified Glaciimonas]MEB0013647.1 EAL domain-containing response regulator [Glaciimonas sp. Cout2]MEB0083673.1 EAL domain-containing response regulator [Glaciimonas sp. Gout2]
MKIPYSIFSNQKILVLEKDQSQRATLVMYLKVLGVGFVAEAADAQQALALLDGYAEEFDFTICDLRMGGMDGIEFLREAPRAKIGRVILSSALEDDLLCSAEEIILSYGIRLSGRIIKPVKFSNLKNLISPALHPQKAEYVFRKRVPFQCWSKEDLSTALKRGQFVPYFQPKLDFATRTPVGVEVLARWMHPDQGVIPPSQFIPLMESAGLIDQLTEDLLCNVLESTKKWYSTRPEISISINASPLTLENTAIPNRWLAIVKEHQVNPERITIEVTETALPKDYKGLLESVTRLQMHGFGLSLDDFGTGYSSLQQLSQMPFNEIKIDQSFIASARKNKRSILILNSIVNMAKNLDLRTVAEGIESESDATFFQELGFDVGQGYHFAKPMSGDDLVRWLSSEQSVAQKIPQLFSLPKMAQFTQTHKAMRWV